MKTHNLFISSRFDEDNRVPSLTFVDTSACPFVIKRIETQMSIAFDENIKHQAYTGVDDNLLTNVISVSCSELSPKPIAMCVGNFAGNPVKTVTTVNGVSLSSNRLSFTLEDEIFGGNPLMPRAGLIMLLVTFYDE